MSKIDKIVSILEHNNYAYRTNDYSWFTKRGLVPLTDEQYDDLLDELILLDSKHPFLKKIGYDISDKKKEELPVKMYSADKIHTIDEYYKWVSRNNIPIDSYLVLTPKLDGISLLVKESLDFVKGDSGTEALSKYKLAWTRGDGNFGKNVSFLYKKIDNVNVSNGDVGYDFYSNGELIISKSNYAKYFKDKINPKSGNVFGPPRNVVSGLFNDDDVSDFLSHVDYIRYNLTYYDGMLINKSKMLDILNNINKVNIPYRNVRVKDVTESLLNNLFDKWSIEYQIDGIVIDVDDSDLRKELGIHTSGKYPNYLIAYKPDKEERKVTTTKDIKLQISKQGFVKPVLSVNPITLDGANVSSVTANNMRYVINNKLGIGSEILIKRSGFVIPKIINVLKPVEVNVDDLKCPVCNSKLVWAETNSDGIDVEMMCSNVDCPGIQYKRILSFFKILEIENFSDGIIDILFKNGFTTIKKMTGLTVDDLLKIKGFKEKKANKIINSINAKMYNIPISKLQHASGYFYGLGSKKLFIINKYIRDTYNTYDVNLTLDELVKLDGFQEKSAIIFLNNIKKFWNFIKYLNFENRIDYNDGEIQVDIQNMISNKNVVFTQIRDKKLEEFIKKSGGVVKSSVSTKTDFLVLKELNSGTSKENKATELGISILTIDEFKKLINYDED